MSAFAPHLAVLFANPYMSQAATYCPNAGAEVSVRACSPPRGHTQFSPFEVGASKPADRFQVLASAVPAPREGDVLKLATGERFTVRKAEYEDADRLVWLLDVDRRA